MKESKILKILAYLTLLVLMVSIVLSSYVILLKENYSYYNEEEYFNSQYFASRYMSYLQKGVYSLIHYKNSYHSLKDKEIEIRYLDNDQTYYYSDVKNGYFLIIYNDIALTNVELTNTTTTIEDIKYFIEKNENAKNVNIIYGDIQSESEIIQNLGIQYLDGFKEVYYMIDDNNKRVYKETEVKDFEIYSSYIEEFKEHSKPAVINKLMKKISPVEKYSYFIIPVSAILIVLIFVYLIIAIGHEKGVLGIYLNDFDKIPLEIILFVALIIGCIPFIILESINENYNAIISLIITAFLLIYILFAICLHTIIKRIKAKTILKSSLSGKILIWIKKCVKTMYSELKSIWETITYSTNLKLKVFLYFIFIAIIGILILMLFGINFITFLLEMVLLALVAYKIIKVLNGFSLIENKLKEMYEGNNQNILDNKQFIQEFQNTVTYLNDISNGFENAIQDRIKSERLKAELITNVSHDIKTPLTSIINYVDLLKQEDIQNEKAKEYIGILNNKSQRLKKLTEDLVEASKISTGNISLNIEKINIVELIKQALGEFEERFKLRGLKPIVECNENEINIKADSRYMYRIIENLFSNISKYALENSRVYIDIKKTQEQVLVEIKNISKERLNISADELMRRFVRGDKARTTEGSGLGISIAQNLTELQNGQFRLKLDGDLFKVELVWEM